MNEENKKPINQRIDDRVLYLFTESSIMNVSTI